MKHLLVSLFLLVSVVLLAQEQETAAAPILTFDEQVFDFGEITQGDVVEHVFTFTNTGDSPLILTNARGSCGCTVPSYQQNTPIAPGESSEMTVRFSSRGKRGMQNKTVTITSNASNSPTQIRITTNVLVPPPPPATEDESTGSN